MRLISNEDVKAVSGGKEAVITVVVSHKKMTEAEKKAYDEAYMDGIKDAAKTCGPGT